MKIKPTFNQRKKETVAKSLFAIGESNFARDFLASNEPESFEYIEDVMRNALRGRNSPKQPPETATDRRWKKVISNAIASAQFLRFIP